jgi:hypothetical protein
MVMVWPCCMCMCVIQYAPVKGMPVHEILDAWWLDNGHGGGPGSSPPSETPAGADHTARVEAEHLQAQRQRANTVRALQAMQIDADAAEPDPQRQQQQADGTNHAAEAPPSASFRPPEFMFGGTTSSAPSSSRAGSARVGGGARAQQRASDTEPMDVSENPLHADTDRDDDATAATAAAAAAEAAEPLGDDL